MNVRGCFMSPAGLKMHAVTCWAMIVAAGKGRRFGGSVPKQYAELAGRPLLAWSLESFERCAEIDAVLLVVEPGQRERARALVERHDLSKVQALVDGGEQRTDSVRQGLAALPEDCRLVAIHDGARPLVRPNLVARVVGAARKCGAAIPALAVRDTVKRADHASSLDSEPLVIGTQERRGLYLAQTPQVFARDLITRAYEWAGDAPATDDAQLVERLGQPVTLVAGDATNIKVTHPADLQLAGLLLRARGDASGAPRVGTGYDVHRLVPGRPLILGGVQIPYPLGLQGHSDADVLAHAVGDALLGAAALGDLGRHFPPTDPSIRGIGSLVLLERIASMVAKAGLVIGNVDATVVCQAPRLTSHIAQMQANLARCLGLSASQVSVKATTTEGLGFTGQGDGLAAQAVVLLVPIGSSPR